jgi:microcystin degradation protein MlrC
MKTKKSYRVALLGIYHESNTFIETPTTLQDFINGHWLKGEAIRDEYLHAHHEIGGMLEVLDLHSVDVIPIMFAEATPGGKISNSAYELLQRDMMALLQPHLPVDACLVVPHGAGVTDQYPDMDGHWLSVLRETVGIGVPIVGSLDPHANVSEAMAKATDALVAYKTNPHLDQRETGKMAASLLVKFLNGEIKPVQKLTQTPVAISIEQQGTAAQPCKQLYDLANDISQQEGILSVSILLGFPYADVEEMGSAFIVVSNELVNGDSNAGDLLKSYLVEQKENFVGQKNTISSQLPLIKDFKKPVLLLDMGDNVGAGSPGNSTYLLQALEEYGQYKSFICIFDPGAVTLATTHAKGQSFMLSFGSEDGTRDGKNFSCSVTLLSVSDGKFKEASPRHGGQVNYDMGKIALVETAAGNIVLLISYRVPPFSLSQLTSFGIYPADFDVVIAKGVNAPIAAYGPHCATIIQVNTPGVTQADMTLFNYEKRRKPLYPFESF